MRGRVTVALCRRKPAFGRQPMN